MDLYARSLKNIAHRKEGGQLMRIAIIGDYDQNRPSHIATSECLKRTSSYLSKHLVSEWLPTASLEENHTLKVLHEFDGIWGAPGEHESHLGMVNAIQFARENNIPYLGT